MKVYVNLNEAGGFKTGEVFNRFYSACLHWKDAYKLQEVVFERSQVLLGYDVFLLDPPGKQPRVLIGYIIPTRVK